MKNRMVWGFVAGLACATIVFAAAGTRYGPDYAADRAEVDDLHARYLFALDFHDPELYASTFAPDGVLEWAGGTVRGRDAIVREMQQAREVDERAAAGMAPVRPAARRHFVTNVAIRFDGDRATERAYWFEFNDDMRDRRPYLGAYGHYENELRRVDGRWLFARIKIYNEQRDNMAAGQQNPAW